jgi:hypothetical protein
VKWYTRKTQNLLSQDVGVRVPPWAPNNSYGKVGANRSPNYRRTGMISCNVRNAVGKWSKTQDSPLKRISGVTGFDSRDKSLFFFHNVFVFLGVIK